MEDKDSLNTRCWNGNGTLWSLPGLFLVVIGTVDIILVTETHESPTHPLPEIPRFYQLSTYRDKVRFSSWVKGFGGVSCLILNRLANVTTIVLSNNLDRFMWIRAKG